MVEQQKGDIVIYERKDGAHFDVTLHNETVWLSQADIANLFVVKKAAISKHIKNIYDSRELERRSTVSKMETVQREGGRLVRRHIEYFNLDMIIAVGYRVNTRHATQFRIWATRILHDHIVKGFTINAQRLKSGHEVKIRELERTVALLQRKLEEARKSSADSL